MSSEEICYFCGRPEGELIAWFFDLDRRTTHTECWSSPDSASPDLPTRRPETAAV